MNWKNIVRAMDVARTLKVVLFDVDGVIFPAKSTAGSSNPGKVWSYPDGQGISLLRAIGLHIAFITSEQGKGIQPICELVKRWNNLPSATQERGWSPIVLYSDMGGENKVIAAAEFLSDYDVTFEQAAYMGDDLTDVPLMNRVGLPTAPKQAEQVIQNIALFTSVRCGGEGAVRDLSEFILAARGIDQTKIPSR